MLPQVVGIDLAAGTQRHHVGRCPGHEFEHRRLPWRYLFQHSPPVWTLDL